MTQLSKVFSETYADLEKMIQQPSAEIETLLKLFLDCRSYTERNFIIYIDKILESYLDKDEPINFIHLHFPFLFKEQKSLILKYIAAKFFFRDLRKDSCKVEKSDYLESRIRATLLRKQKVQAPYNAKASGLKFRKYQEELSRYEDICKFYDQLNVISSERAELKPKTLINIGKENLRMLTYEGKGTNCFGVDIDDFDSNNFVNRSYVLLNSEKTINEICQSLNCDDDSLIYDLENIIVFDTNKSIHKTFNTRKLIELNMEGCSIKNLIIICIEDDLFSLSKAIQRGPTISTTFDRVKETTNDSCYFFGEYELELLLENKIKFDINPIIEWLKGVNWFNDLFDQIKDQDGPYELISLRMRNIYANCCNEEMRNYILNDIFSNNEGQLIASDTWHNIGELNEDRIDSLYSTIDLVLQEAVKTYGYIKSKLIKLNSRKNKIALILPYEFKYNKKLRGIFYRYMSEINFSTYTWKDIKDDNIKDDIVVVLTYRDHGGYPYRIRPSLFEGIPSSKEIIAILNAPLFQDRYNFAKYQYLITLAKRIFDNPIRRKYQHWDKVLKIVNSIKPLETGTIFLESEDDQEQEYDRETITVSYTDGTTNTSYSTRKYIVLKDGSFSVHTIEEIFSIDDVENLYVQELDKTDEGLNLFPITHEEEQQVDMLRRHFQLKEEEERCELWKVLLKRKALAIGQQSLYEQLSDYCNQRGLDMVSRNHFIQGWLEIKSELSKPLRNKLFRCVCEYLGLPSEYIRVVIKRCASERKTSKEITQKMNYLLSILVKEGAFENGTIENPNTIVKQLNGRFDLEDIGISAENPIGGLTVLIELIKGNLKLKQIKSLTRNE